MAKRKKKSKQWQASKMQNINLQPSAPDHSLLKNNSVNIFVDDQNLFYGITNNEKGQDYRIDFGDLLRVAATSTETNIARFVDYACVSGVIPDDDSFWKVAENRGFDVLRGFIGANGRSKQDDARLITKIMKTVFTQEEPSTIVLVAGDADYVPPLEECVQMGWRVEIAFTGTYGNISRSLEAVCHEFRYFSAGDIERQW